MSPYIVTVKPDACPEGVENCRCVGHSRHAVATLEDACAVTVATITAQRAWEKRLFYPAARALTESGGTVGPLPDGTVIEVELESSAASSPDAQAERLAAGGHGGGANLQGEGA